MTGTECSSRFWLKKLGNQKRFLCVLWLVHRAMNSEHLQRRKSLLTVVCLARLNVKGLVKRLSQRAAQSICDVMVHETGSWRAAVEVNGFRYSVTSKLTYSQLCVVKVLAASLAQWFPA